MRLSLFLAGAAGFGCLIAAARDVGWRTIDNSLVLVLLLLWGAFAVSRGMAWPDVGWHLATGGTAFVVLLAAYAAGWVGGGDVKLAAPVFVWAGPGGAVPVLLLIGLGGGVAGLCALVARGLCRLPLPAWLHRGLSPLSAERGVPYGVALALGGLLAILSALAEG